MAPRQLSIMTRESRNATTRGRHGANSRAAAATALAFLLCGCATQAEEVREDVPARSAEEAARETVLIEPGPPPPDLASPSDAVVLERLRKRAEERRAAATRLREEVAVPRYQDVWARIRAGFGLPHAEHRRIDAELRWYSKRPDYMQRTTDRARLYLAYIAHEAERRELPMELALLPIVESAFQPYARSPAGAMGIWQFMGATGRRYGLRQTAWYDGRRDIVRATRAAFDYLERLHDVMDGDWLLAVAAYNTGEGNVRRARARNRARGKPTDFFSLRLPAETRAYVPRLLAISRLVGDPQAHGITLDPIDDEPYFRRVDVGGQIDLGRAAEMAGVSYNEMMLLNPGFMRHATDPNGPHELLVPAEAVPAFQQALAVLPPEERMVWSMHEVAHGDTLSGIAHRYGVSVESLRAANGMDGHLLQVGQELRVPGSHTPDELAALSPAVRAGIQRALEARAPGGVYRVRRGDSLWTISRRHRVSLSRLMRRNGLSRKSVLRPGQKLVIPGRRSAAAHAMTPTTGPRPGVHVVRFGDSLWTISRRYRISTDDLARWNRIDKNAILHPGQTLRLSPPPTTAAAPDGATGT
jgi:membrane-bound lytic murein transglycosylase D